MRSPSATYRVQLSPNFTFNDLEEIIPYLADFGASTIYAAPILQSRKGSTHGYDCINPHKINPEIGTLEDLERLKEKLNENNMTWLQDIVPNHMAFSGSNIWMNALLELGPASQFYDYFDIDWNYKNLNKVMAPFFGDPLEEILKKRELVLKFAETGFSFHYFDQFYPVSARSYPKILSKAKIENWPEKFKNATRNKETWEDSKMDFYKAFSENPEIKEKLNSCLKELNSSEEKLREILELQYFLPRHWKSTEKEINYRRFFTINDLICLRMEDKKVFADYHSFIRKLCDEGTVHGLRIDHVDGLFDPTGYLDQLRQLVGPKHYIVVEKILEKDEKLPAKWPVQGSSGYGFLAQVNHLFTQTENEAIFTSEYKKLVPEYADFEKLIFEKKLFVLKERMGGELENLWNFLLQQHFLSEAENPAFLKSAFCGFLAAFPVYRIYPEKFPLTKNEQEIIETTYQTALKFKPEEKTGFDFFKNLFLGKVDKDPNEMLFFLQRCQQFTGPLAAKGAEDTVFYIYNRLLSHNEVGDSPENFGISVNDFHELMVQRQRNFPLSLNATATHDTKRGEDARMRLNFLSEIPQEWFKKVGEWRKNNKKFKKEGLGPDANEEYFIYQSLLGAAAFKEDDEDDFLPRTTEYLQKMLREAKIHSTWAEPDEKYENSVFDFVTEIWRDHEFRQSFDPFLEKIAFFGCIKSLGQGLLKITAPGIPDIYQGTELWDFSYVDPDNRRPVDFNLRKSYISEIKNIESFYLNNKLNIFQSDFTSGQLKMYGLHQALEVRRAEPVIFEKGEYIPVRVSGKNSEKFICFIRHFEGKWVMVLLPVLVSKMFEPGNFNPKPGFLDSLELSLPEHAPKIWTNVYDQKRFDFEKKSVLKDLFRHFPVVLLKSNF